MIWGYTTIFGNIHIHKLHGSVKVCVLFLMFLSTKSFRFLQKANDQLGFASGGWKKQKTFPNSNGDFNGDESHEVPLDHKMMNPMKVLGPPNI